jgi:histidine phosphotransferase ChpT
MSALVDMRILELLSARLCHELVGPVTAINNGVELLGEDDPEFVRDAVALVGQSAGKAAQLLQFYRFAYGTLTPGSSGGPDPRELSRNLLDGGKVTCEWSAAAVALTSEWHKLACNMLVLAAAALPRGGKVEVAVPAAGGGLSVAARGDSINVTPEGRAALERTAALADLTPRTVQGFFTACLAEQLAVSLIATVEATQFTLTAKSG